MASDDFEERVAGVASLAEPQRRALYRFVVTRDASGEQGRGRGGDGSGPIGCRLPPRPARRRRAADHRVPPALRPSGPGRRAPGEAVPARRGRAVGQPPGPPLRPRRHGCSPPPSTTPPAPAPLSRRHSPASPPSEDADSANGRAWPPASGRAAAALIDAALAVLDEQGYEPRTQGNEVVLANCPFHALVDEQRDLVCGMNHDLLCGLAAGSRRRRARRPAGAVRRHLLRPPPRRRTDRHRSTADWKRGMNLPDVMGSSVRIGSACAARPERAGTSTGSRLDKRLRR